MKINLRRSLYDVCVSSNDGSTWHSHSPLDQDRPILALQEHLPHTSLSIKQVLHQTEPQIPLQRSGKHASLAFFRPYKSVQEGWQRYPEIQELLVEQRNEIVFLSHDAVCDIVCIEFGSDGCCRRRRKRCKWVLLSDRTYATIYLRTRYCLDVCLEMTS